MYPAGMDAVYLRISEDRLGLELGVKRQREECRDLVKGSAREFVDNDLSATKGKPRPGYQNLLAAIKAGQVKRVIVWHQSRLWRNRTERAQGIEIMRKYAVSVVPVKGATLDLSTAYGRSMAGFLGEMDTWESDVKSERLVAWAKQRAELGLHHGGPRLHGYTVHGDAPVPEEAEEVARWFKDLVGGRPLVAIARDAGTTLATMRQRLRNPRYAGLRVLKGRRYEGAWPAIVDVATWQAAVTLLDGRLRGPARARTQMSGLALCERCNLPVAAWAFSDRGRSGKAYKCVPSRGGCGRVWRMSLVDVFVSALVRSRLARKDLANLLPVHDSKHDKLRKEADGIRARLTKLGAEYVVLGLDEAAVKEAVAAGRARLAAIEAKLPVPTDTGPLSIIIGAKDPVKMFDSLEDVQQKQAVIRALMKVTLTAPPRGRFPAGTDEEIVAWYAQSCVRIQWKAQ